MSILIDRNNRSLEIRVGVIEIPAKLQCQFETSTGQLDDLLQ